MFYNLIETTFVEKSIYKTIIYFDLFNYPLTKEELFRYLWVHPNVSYEEFCQALQPPIANQAIEVKYGYLFLPGREEIVEIRRRAITPTELKLKKARAATMFISWLPFLRANFVCNSIGAEMTKPDSDIDFFIITEKDKIWFVRFFTNAILRLLGLRTYGEKQSNRVCLSFFVDNRHLNLASWRVAEDDIHFAYWIHQMIPVYDPLNYYKKFLESNYWTRKYLPKLISRCLSRVGAGWFNSKIKKILE